MSTSPYKALLQGWFNEVPLDAVQPLGDGHINDTYLATIDADSAAAAANQFVLQRLSDRVFADPDLVLSNVCRVLDHCAGKELQLPELISGREGSPLWRDEDGSIWRLWRFRADTRVLTAPLSAEEVHQAGWAFGRFQHLMSDLPEPQLLPAIGGFLDLRHYLKSYDRAVATADASRCRSEADFIAARRNSLSGQLLPGQDYIHGDCKLDNLLFNTSSSQLDCVIDLDTVMLGHWAWDFGDLVRSIATTQGSLTPELFAAAARGFCAGKGILGADHTAALSEPIIETLLEAPGYVTFMLVVRFVTDHLLGDQYFKVARHGDNLQRARAQIALYLNIEQHLPELRRQLSDTADGAL